MSANGALLGFDFGTKRIGIAIGQPLTGSARPLTTLKSRDGVPDWDSISALIKEWQPVALIVGLPLDMDGGEQEMTRLARRFGNRLAGRYNLPVHHVDERMTSMEARQSLVDMGKNDYEKDEVDRIAAQLILQTWLDQHPASEQP